LKYRQSDKKKRNARIMEYRAKGYTLRAIAGVFHISAERVHAIIKREAVNDNPSSI
jgi:DNA-binding CsgD family transcriptional regulator